MCVCESIYLSILMNQSFPTKTSLTRLDVDFTQP